MCHFTIKPAINVCSHESGEAHCPSSSECPNILHPTATPTSCFGLSRGTNRHSRSWSCDTRRWYAPSAQCAFLCQMRRWISRRRFSSPPTDGSPILIQHAPLGHGCEGLPLT